MERNIDFSKVGKTTGPFNHPYTEKDMMTYGLGIGAGRDELEFVYEKNLKIVPCYGAILVNDPDLIAESWDCGFDPYGSLQWGFDLHIMAPFKTSGTFVTYSTLRHLYDRGATKGCLIDVETKTYDEDGNLLCVNESNELAGNDGGFGGEKPPFVAVEFPDRAPDYSINDQIADNQALIYRLTGDVNPLHCDPEFYEAAGFQKPVLHGMCTAGFACRAVIKALIQGQPERLTRFKLRCTNLVFPGDKIRTDIWVMEDGVAHFRTMNVETGKSVLDYGIAEWK